MCFGTFDLLHLGHINYFQQAKEHGNHLIVVIARDKTKEDQKKETIFDEEERKQLVQSLKIVDEAILGNYKNHLKIIEEIKPDVICLGYDHPVKEQTLAELLLKEHLYPKIKRMKPYQDHKHKSNKIRAEILKKD